MREAEHRRPLAAFLMVFAAACLIMGNGLRTHVVDVLVGSGAPRQLFAAIAPDMILGQSLSNARRAPTRASGEVPSSNGSGDSGDRAAQTDLASVNASSPQATSPASAPVRSSAAVRHGQGHPPRGQASGADSTPAAPAAPVTVRPAAKPTAKPPTPESAPGVLPSPGKQPVQPVASPGEGPRDGSEGYEGQGGHAHSQGFAPGTEDRRDQDHRHTYSGSTRTDTTKPDHGSDDRGHDYGHRGRDGGDHRGQDRGDYRGHDSRGHDADNDSRGHDSDNDSRGHDSRGHDSRGHDSRGHDSRNDSGNGSRDDGQGRDDHQDSGRGGGFGHHR